MRYAKMAVLLGGAMAVAPAAWADTTYTVDKVIIAGSKTVPVEKLYAAIQEHAGSRVTTADIIADQDAITKVLSANNVVGGIKTSMAATPNKHIVVTFALDDQGAQAPVVTHVAAKLHDEIFVGNKSIPSDKLLAASGLTPGQNVSSEQILAAEQAVLKAYKDSKLPISVNITGENKQISPGHYDVIWTIVETKAKKKKNTDDDGGEKVDQ
jgi:outer membrane protein assembly factor BamA